MTITLLWILVTLLIYQILVRVNASELMWFLFWVYVPVSLFATALMKIKEEIADENKKKNS